jgi:hypothetical protein
MAGSIATVCYRFVLRGGIGGPGEAVGRGSVGVLVYKNRDEIATTATSRAVAAVDVSLGRGAADVLGARALRALTNVELNAVALAEILEPLSVHCTLVEEVFGPAIVLDEAEPLIHS